MVNFMSIFTMIFQISKKIYRVLSKKKKKSSKDMNLSKLREIVKDREAWRAEVHGVAKRTTEKLNNSKDPPQDLAPEALPSSPSRF